MLNSVTVSPEATMLSQYSLDTEEFLQDEWEQFCKDEFECEAMDAQECLNSVEQEEYDHSCDEPSEADLLEAEIKAEWEFGQLSDTEQGIAIHGLSWEYAPVHTCRQASEVWMDDLPF